MRENHSIHSRIITFAQVYSLMLSKVLIYQANNKESTISKFTILRIIIVEYVMLSTYFYLPQDVQFARNYTREPTIVIAARHNSEGNNLKPIYMSVTAWIEARLRVLMLFRTLKK